MKWVKISVLAVVSALIAALLGVAVVVLLVDPNDYKSTIERIIAERSGLRVELAGDLRFRPSLRPTIGIDRVNIASTDPGAGQFRAEIAELDLSFRLVPLLRNEFQLDRLVVEGANVWLREGKPAVDRGRPEKAASTAPALREALDSSLPLIGQVLVKRVNVRFLDDGGKPVRTVLIDQLDAARASNEDRIDIKGAGRLDREPFRLDARLGAPFAYVSGTSPLSIVADLAAIEARFEARGKIDAGSGPLRPDLDVTVSGAKLGATLAALGRIVPVPAALSGIEPGSFRAKARVKTGKGTLGLDAVDLALGKAPNPYLVVAGSVADALSVSGLDLRFNGTGDGLSELIVSVLAKSGFDRAGTLPPLKPVKLTGRLTGGIKTVSVPGMALAYGGANPIRVSVSGKILHVTKDPSIDGVVEIASPTVAELVEAARPFVAELPASEIPSVGPFKIKAHVRGRSSRFSIANIDLKAGKPGDLLVEAKGSIADPIVGRGISVPFLIEARDIEKPARWLDVDAPRLPMRLAGTLRDIRNGYAIDGMDLKLGQSDAAGRVAIELRGKAPWVEASLKSKFIDIDELSPNTKLTVPPTAPPAVASTAADASVPDRVIEPPGVRGKLSLEVEKVQASGRRVSGATSLTISSQDRRLSIDVHTRGEAGGVVQAKAGVDYVEPEPSLSVEIKAKNLELGRVLPALLGSRAVEGRLTAADISVVGKGKTVAALRSSLSGRTALSLGKAQVNSTGGAFFMDDIILTVFQTINPMHRKSEKISVKCAEARAWISDGIVRFPGSIGVETDAFAALASGKVDLKADRIEMTVRPIATSGLRLSLSQALAELVEVKGPIASPEIGVSALGAATMAARIGAAVATFGASYLAELALVDKDRIRKACSTASNATSEGGESRLTKQPVRNVAREVGGVLESGGETIEGVLEGTGSLFEKGVESITGTDEEKKQ